MPQNKQRKKMIRLSTIAILLFFLIPSQINAWWPFGPSNFDDCILKYQKKAKCGRASVMINVSCGCKFQQTIYGACEYSSAVYDCILDIIGDAQNDQAAIAIFQVCVSKYNK